LLINDEVIIRFSFAPAHQTRTGETFWRLYNHRKSAEITIFVRLTLDKAEILDFFVIPRIAELWGLIPVFKKKNAQHVSLYCTKTLDTLVAAFSRCTIREDAWDAQSLHIRESPNLAATRTQKYLSCHVAQNGSRGR